MNNLYTFHSKNYIITTDLNDYLLNISLTNNQNSTIYQYNSDIRNLNSPLGKDFTYSVIVESFKKTPNYTFKCDFINNEFNMFFQHSHLNIDINFNIILKQHKQSIENNNIKLLTDKIEILEEINNKQSITNNDLLQQINQLNMNMSVYKIMFETFGDLEIRLTKTTGSTVYFPINSKEIDISNITLQSISKIKSFYMLDKLSIHTTYDKIYFENNNISYLVLNAPDIKTLEGINLLPNIETIEFINCSSLYDIIPFLKPSKINKLIFKNCGDNQKRNLTTYCKAKNIELLFIK